MKSFKLLYTVFAIIAFTVAGFVAGVTFSTQNLNQTVVVNASEVQEKAMMCQSHVSVDVSYKIKLALHNSGIAVFDLPPSLKNENKVFHDQKKVVKQNTKKNIKVEKKNNTTVQTVVVEKKEQFVVVVNDNFKDQQMEPSANADTLFVASMNYRKHKGKDVIALKKQLPQNLIFSNEFGTIFNFDAGLTSQVNKQMGTNYVVDVSAQNQSVTIADTGMVQQNDSINDTNSTVQSEESNQILSRETVVKDDNNKTEEVPLLKHQKVKKKKLPNDNEIVKHNHKKLKKEKKEKKKKKSKESIEFHF